MLNNPQKSSLPLKKSKKLARGRLADGQPNPVDVYVGVRLFLRRRQLNFSQEYLASMLGISFQQIQKYEHGDNRISASRLWDFSRVLNVSVEYFFLGMDAEITGQSPRMNLNSLKEIKQIVDDFSAVEDPMLRTENIRLMNTIDTPKIAELLYELITEIKHCPGQILQHTSEAE